MSFRAEPSLVISSGARSAESRNLLIARVKQAKHTARPGEQTSPRAALGRDDRFLDFARNDRDVVEMTGMWSR